MPLRRGKPLQFKELSLEQRRRLVDVQQAAETLRSAEAEKDRRFSGSMAWKSRSGLDYLYRRHANIEKSLGPRSPETEAAYEAFGSGKVLAQQQVAGLKLRLEGMAAVNRAMELGRVPLTVARILRRLDATGLLGDQVCVVGTNALFAYEAMAGLHFGTGLLATDDLDIALDARKNLTLAGRLLPAVLIGVLQQVDRSFALLGEGHYRAANAAGMLVDLITPEPRDRMKAFPVRKRRLGGSPDPVPGDLTAAEVPRLEMIVDAPRVTSVALDERGLPVAVSAADPRWWAAHKLWLARQGDREPLKRSRDHAQGMAVAGMLAGHWASLDVSDGALASIPSALRERLRAAISAGEEARSAAEW